jgi:hypothetical protein
MTPSLTRRRAIGAGSSSWAGSKLKTQGKTGRLLHFSVRLRIQSALEEMPLALVRCITEATYTPATTVFPILTEVVGLRFRHWRWVPHLISDDQQFDRARQALMLLSTLTAA